MTLELHGYSSSVYSRIARLTLHEKSVEYLWREVDPFRGEPSDEAQIEAGLAAAPAVLSALDGLAVDRE